jgi:hypothetical protein
VREGGTRLRDARGGDGELRGGTGGGATWWLDNGETRWCSGGDEREEERLFTGGRGWAPFIASRGGGRRRRGGKSGGGETVVGNRGHGKSTAATV